MRFGSSFLDRTKLVGMHFLVTGHTGFKGAWLTLLLQQRGHSVAGLALDPAPGSLFERAELAPTLVQDHRVDIRDRHAVRDVISASGADVIIHMAAQPLVRESYRDPRYTYETNVDGTLNVLDALAELTTLKATLIVTTDKVYRNDGRRSGYAESDALGGIDPYSTSKAMADLLTQSWSTTAMTPIAIARAGNVIGGGDVCAERLIPDLVHAHQHGEATTLRNPDAVRPWQHVLDCLDGYTAIVDALLEGRGAGAWNVGPAQADAKTVGEVATAFLERLGGTPWRHVPDDGMTESHLLSLDSSHIANALGWSGRLHAETAVEWTADWHTTVGSRLTTARIASELQIAQYEALR